jgi:hypothetical protein
VLRIQDNGEYLRIKGLQSAKKGHDIRQCISVRKREREKERERELCVVCVFVCVSVLPAVASIFAAAFLGRKHVC